MTSTRSRPREPVVTVMTSNIEHDGGPDEDKRAPQRWLDWANGDITDQLHMMHRTNPGPDGTRVSCTYADETLLGAGLHDPARYAAHTLRQPDALVATAGRDKPGQGGERRIDRIYNDPWLTNAVIAVSVIDTTGISDHHAVKVVYSRAGMAEGLRRNATRLAPHDLTS
ncbi:hypothetical protein QF035_009066 [Streptomyces umbrinus]|uniref:Uncharacterized protein n=1 Tax=Streptomyces umbrinus TaxID=67370 RepID=A0ABU0T6R0_9ACTN|nr:hypothetical protein [Streptomyces umbrinus]MDQ1031484.1 hypothetical protein [Streptomyces umbrinus]